MEQEQQASVYIWKDGKQYVLCEFVDAWIARIQAISDIRRQAKYFLYACKDELTGDTVYVGVTKDPVKRARMHCSKSKWWNDNTRMELLRTFECEYKAGDAERRLIKATKTAKNKKVQGYAPSVSSSALKRNKNVS